MENLIKLMLVHLCWGLLALGDLDTVTENSAELPTALTQEIKIYLIN